MKIVHFDVDQAIFPYLNDDKYVISLQNISQLLSSRFQTVDAVTIKSFSFVNQETLSYFPKLRLIVTRTVGVDHIDFTTCKKRNIAVYHLADYGAYNIAEHAFALLLAGARQIVAAQTATKQGQFSHLPFLGLALRHKILGVVGTGKIGKEMIKIASGFGMKILAYDIAPDKELASRLGFSYVSFYKLLESSEVISLHVPLLPSTRHLIDDGAIRRMRQNVILINTARGGLVDTQALVRHIDKFRFVGLDVVDEEEKFSKNNPLLSFANVIITPHMAFFTDDSVKTIAQATQNCIDNFLAGKREGRVV